MKVIPIRASSMPDLVECPARWYATQIEGKSTPSSVATWLGTSLHGAFQLYDQVKLEKGVEMRVEDAQAAFVQSLWNPTEEVLGEEAEYEKAETNGLELVRKYATLIAPRRRYVAIEAKCPTLTVEVEGVSIILSGTLDRIQADELDRLGVLDFKSGSTVVKADETIDVDPFRPQLGVYEILGHGLMGRPLELDAEVIGLGANGKARVAAAPVPNAAASLVGTAEKPGFLQYAARIAKHEVWFGNPKSILCGAKFCPVYSTCRFRGQ